MDLKKLKNKTIKDKINGVGRPTKFKPEYCQKLIDHMKQGFSFASFTAETKVNQDTLYHWLKIYPEFADAYIEADACNRKTLEGVLLGNATGKLKGNAAAAIFIIKNRFPADWRDKQEFAIEDVTNVSNDRLKELAAQALAFISGQKNEG